MYSQRVFLRKKGKIAILPFVKKTTQDIRKDRQKIVDLRTPQRRIFLPKRFGKKKNTAIYVPKNKEKYLDIKAKIEKPKHHRYEKKQKKIWSTTYMLPFLFVSIFSLIVLAGNNVIAKKNELQNIGMQLKNTFSMVAKSPFLDNTDAHLNAFTELEKNISAIQKSIGPFSLLGGKNGEKPIYNLLLLAEEGSHLKKQFSDISREAKKLPQFFIENDQNNAWKTIEKIKNTFVELQKITVSAQKNISLLQKNTLLPNEWKEKCAHISWELKNVEKNVTEIQEIIVAVETLFGKNGPHITALFYQNTGEIRATGGFIGSMSYLFADKDFVTAEFNDIYSLSWKDTSNLPPPEGFERLATKLNLQDANFDPHFPYSAKALRTMLGNTNSPLPQSIMTINDDALFAVLDAVGGIFVPELHTTITAENADMLLSFFVEAKATGQKTPKNILRKMIPQLLEKVQQLPPQKIIQLIQEAKEKKWILAYSRDPNVEKVFQKIGIDGAIQPSNAFDTLAVFSANVGGNKSDRFVQEIIHITSAISAEKKVINTLEITHKHTWGEAENKRFAKMLHTFGSYTLTPNLLREILGAGDNHEYMQVFVPKGSVLVGAKNLPKEKIILKERNGKTVFSFRFPKVSAGKSETVTLQYRLPERKEKNFNLFFQSQSGRKNVHIIREVVAETGVDFEGENITAQKTNGDVLFFGRIR